MSNKFFILLVLWRHMLLIFPLLFFYLEFYFFKLLFLLSSLRVLHGLFIILPSLWSSPISAQQVSMHPYLFSTLWWPWALAVWSSSGVWFLYWESLRKSQYSSPCSCQLPTDSQVGVKLHAYLPTPGRGFVWLGLAQILMYVVNHCELLVHVYPEDPVLVCSFNTSG